MNRFSSDTKLSAIQQQIYELITEVAPYSGYDDGDDENREFVSVVVKAKTRESSEVTDRLWCILKCKL